MSDERDIIVFDEEYEFASEYIKNYSEHIIMLMENYERCMDIIVGQAIDDNAISNKLKKIVDDVKVLKEPIKEICENVSSEAKKYIEKIDKTDDKLY